MELPRSPIVKGHDHVVINRWAREASNPLSSGPAQRGRVGTESGQREVAGV